jgi:two-component system, NtrC family, nitrogen regulation response regulator NtrX
VIIIEVPSLNDRRDDIPILIHYFLEQISTETGNPIYKIEQEATKYLTGIDWSGNIRQLRNTIERLTIMAEDKIDLSTTKKFT